MAKIGFCCTWSATDPNANSGYAYSIRRQLAARYDLVDLFWHPAWPHAAFLPYKVSAVLRGEHYGYEREPRYLSALARAMERWATKTGVDAIVCPTTLPVTRYRGSVPVVVVTDQVFPSALRSYMPHVLPRYRRHGLEQEREALARCAAASFPTAEASEAAVRDCGAAPERVYTIPWGANLLMEPDRSAVERAIQRRSHERCSLAFVGRDWKRKGGDLALETFRELRRAGVPTELTIMGVVPDVDLPDGVRVISYLDKQTTEGWQLFSEILSASHFLVMPSRAEAYGQVYCEAAAFGVPSVAAAVGGVPSILQDRRTGILLDPEIITAAGIAERIVALWSDSAAYEAMAVAVRDEYENRLNWDRFGERFSDVVESVIA